MKLRVTPERTFRRATALLRTDPVSVRAGFSALIISTFAGLVAGVVLGSITGTLVSLPGLIVLAPAAIGLRGNVFGALASRLSTMTQLGDLRFSRRLSTSVGQNLASAAILSISCSFILAGIAKIVSEAFGVRNAISFSDFFVISIVGGLIPTAVVMLVTIYLAKLCVARKWDLDNVGAPLITATGDVVTIPSLVLATLLVRLGWVTPTISVLVSALAIASFAYGFFSRYATIKRIIRESLTVLIIGGSISILAGLTVQGRLDSLSRYPILIVLVPPLLSINGAIGSILSARISTKLHLGTVRADRFGFSPVSEDVTISYLLTVPIFFVLGIFCAAISSFGHLAGPGWFSVVAISVIAGVIATTFSNIVGYVTAVMTYRFGFDPDNFAVPAVTSVSDLIGAVVLMMTIGVLQI
ncbi:MAG TPA: magnesium transporter [Acidimicrobiia bacterium]|nr:magnesium transporter [Acidimicrobiia bacterium]